MKAQGGFEQYGPPIRVEGGLKARSGRGPIGESWWSRRFLAVLESFALGSRLTRGRSYARRGQVLSLEVTPGQVTASVQGSRAKPYRVTVGLRAFDEATWRQVETTLADQAIYGARLLAGEMPAEIEDVFAACGAPLFPASVGELAMGCSCPDWQVPCKHLAATFYLLAEAFDVDPFQILHWRGRERAGLLARLRKLRAASDGDGDVAEDDAAGGRAAVAAAASASARGRRKARAETPPLAPTGAAVALGELTSPDLAQTLDRFWVSPVPLPTRPPTLITDPDLLLRQLPPPGDAIGGPELVVRLRPLYERFTRADR
jgi:uncharacterized Zn finger protein